MNNKETIDVNGNFAVKVGSVWARKKYDAIELNKQAQELTSFADANKLAQETGGTVYVFRLEELSAGISKTGRPPSREYLMS